MGHKEIKEKRKELQLLLDAQRDYMKMHATNVEILRTTVTGEEARKMCQTGAATMKETSEYINQRGILERMVAEDSETIKGTEQIIQRVRGELEALEKQQSEMRKRVLILLLPIFAILADWLVRWIETWGNSFHPVVYEALFCVCMLGLIFDMMWLVNKLGGWWKK